MKHWNTELMLTCLFSTAFMFAACNSGSNGPGGAAQAGHITGKLDGVEWTSSEDVFFVNNDLLYGTVGGPFGGLQIEGGLAKNEFLSIKVSRAKVDSFALANLKIDNFISFEKGSAYYKHRSGKIKITKLESNLVEGEFEAVLVQDDDGPAPGKILTISEGRFSASANPGAG